MINLEVITPYLSYDEKIIWIELDTTVGNIVIKPDHTPMLCYVLDGQNIIYCLPNGKQKILLVKDCLISFMDNNLTLLAQKVE